MTASRRERIESMLVDDPHDVFLRYSLALEFQKEGQHAASLDLLAALEAGDPPYVPAFFMAAQQLVALNRVAEARRALRDGITTARQQDNQHAAAEMSELLTQLGSHGE